MTGRERTPEQDYCPHGYPDFGRDCPDCDVASYLPAVLDLRPRLIVGRELVLETDGRGAARLRRRARRGAAGLGALCALALGAIVLLLPPASSASPPREPCNRIYPAPSLVAGVVFPPALAGPYYAHPVGLEYARCLFRAGRRAS